MLHNLPHEYSIKNNYNKFHPNWMHYKDISKHPLLRTLFTTFRAKIIVCILLSFVQSAIDISSPLVIKYVIKFIGIEDRTVGEGVGVICLVIGMKLF